MQSKDMQRLSVHVACLLVFRRLTSVLQLWDQKTIADLGVEGLAVWHKGRLLLHQEEKLAMRPDVGPQPTELPEDRRALSSKERRRRARRTTRISPGTFHCVAVVRSRTLSQASRKSRRTSSHNGSIRSDTTRSLVIAALLPQCLEPTLILVFHALQGFVQGNNWVFEALFQQLQSRFFQNLIVASRIIKLFLFCPWLLSGPTGLLPSGPPAVLSLPNASLITL